MPHPDRGGRGANPGLKPSHTARLRVVHGRRVLCPQGLDGDDRGCTACRRRKLPEVLLVIGMWEGVSPQRADVLRLRRQG